MAVVLAIGYALEEYRSDFPWLVTLQLRCAALLSTVDLTRADIDRTAIVEIDDATFWSRLGGGIPTNRGFLAKVARIAAGEQPGDPQAAVIAIDIMFVSPSNQPGDHESRRLDNQALLDALRYVTAKGIPVVLASSLITHGSKEEPNIFDDSMWPDGTSLGFINLPSDHRQIPLETTITKWNGVKSTLKSFALQTALSFDRRRVLQPITQSNSTISEAIRDGRFVYGGFRKQKDFPHVSANDVAERKPEALRAIDQKIILIGSTWSQFGIGRGETVDLHETPFGRMPGVYLHANYLEAILSGRVKRPLPGWLASVIDLILGLGLVAIFKRTAKGLGRGVVLFIFVVPMILAYVFFINLGMYLDFVLPLVLLCVHLGFEVRTSAGKGV